MRETNTLIIGQGIAGSLAAFMLHQQGIPFLVIDTAYTNTASRIATGMFSPVSGRRKVISPIILQQIPFAINIYKQLEELLEKTILHIQNIYEMPESLQSQNAINKKLSDAGFAKYIFPAETTLPNLKQDFGAFEITNSGWVDCPLFINSFRDWLRENNLFIEEEFKYEELNIDKENIQYNRILCKKIIFCEGYRVLNNPYFKNESIVPCKGDVLTIEYKDGPASHIIKRDNASFVPLGNNIFKAGSTYNWHNTNESLEEKDKKEIENKLDAILQNKYIVINHQTAIRPTTQNREVIARQHPVYPNLFMLNGLGTKGITQGPWWAKYIVELSVK